MSVCRIGRTLPTVPYLVSQFLVTFQDWQGCCCLNPVTNFQTLCPRPDHPSLVVFSFVLVRTCRSRYRDWLRAGRPRFRSSRLGRVKNFLHVVQTGFVVHPTSYVMGWGVKRPGREADHSPPASSEIKKMWIYTPTPPYAFMHRDKFTDSLWSWMAPNRSGCCGFPFHC
jgi:hypothetical protein